MAYSLDARFAPPPKYFTLLDPAGFYQSEKREEKQNAAPFLSKSPRKTQVGVKLLTQASYNQSLPRKIPNCSSMLSKQPRFPYEAFSAEDLAEILCKCGIQSPCQCPTGKDIEEKDVICQGKVKRRIFKGPAPRSVLDDEGLSAPSRKDQGFKILSDGSQQRLREEYKEECPPFYDARVNESTAFYQGCKWSQRTATRSQKSLEVRPGPAEYFFDREPSKEQICAEKVRAYKRKTSRQLRYMEMVQQRNILEGRPGPSAYNPMPPRYTVLKLLGSKAKRFTAISKRDVCPGPADHWVRRDFEPIAPPDIPCHATLPSPACFGVKANRFKIQREEGPGPASYSVNLRLCQFLNCQTAPFGTSAKRFKEVIIEESDEEDIVEKELQRKDENKGHVVEPCPKPTWEFKSKTIRMKPLVKNSDCPNPTDLPQTRTKIRSSQLQYSAPFFSSEGRFQPWHNWIPIDQIVQPGPTDYCLETPRCPPAFVLGPLYRSERFPKERYKSPAPNEYNVNDGIEKILATHNKRLKNNIENQYKIHWEPPKAKKGLSYEERDAILLNKCIDLLDTEPETATVKSKVKYFKEPSLAETEKPKMLRTFLYARPMPNYY